MLGAQVYKAHHKFTKRSNMLVVNRKKANIYRLGLVGAQRVVFYPGMNVFNDKKQIEALKAHDSFKDLISTGVHEIVNTISEGEIEQPKDISDMSMEKAKILISKVLTITGLESMFHQEEAKKARKGVLSAITDKISELKSPDLKPA